MPLPTRNTCPSGCRRCISRTFHGMSVGGKVTSSPAATHCVGRINVVHPHGHPSAFVGGLVSVWSKRGGIRPPAAAPLASLAKKDLAFA